LGFTIYKALQLFTFESSSKRSRPSVDLYSFFEKGTVDRQQPNINIIVPFFLFIVSIEIFLFFDQEKTDLDVGSKEILPACRNF